MSVNSLQPATYGAERLGVDLQRVYALVREGKVPAGVAVHIGRTVKFDAVRLEGWISAGGMKLPGGWRRGRLRWRRPDAGAAGQRSSPEMASNSIAIHTGAASPQPPPQRLEAARALLSSMASVCREGALSPDPRVTVLALQLLARGAREVAL
jgi:hypothetical protein